MRLQPHGRVLVPIFIYILVLSSCSLIFDPIKDISSSHTLLWSRKFVENDTVLINLYTSEKILLNSQFGVISTFRNSSGIFFSLRTKQTGEVIWSQKFNDNFNGGYSYFDGAAFLYENKLFIPRENNIYDIRDGHVMQKLSLQRSDILFRSEECKQFDNFIGIKTYYWTDSVRGETSVKLLVLDLRTITLETYLTPRIDSLRTRGLSYWIDIEKKEIVWLLEAKDSTSTAFWCFIQNMTTGQEIRRFQVNDSGFLSNVTLYIKDNIIYIWQPFSKPQIIAYTREGKFYWTAEHQNFVSSFSPADSRPKISWGNVGGANRIREYNKMFTQIGNDVLVVCEPSGTEVLLLGSRNLGGYLWGINKQTGKTLWRINAPIDEFTELVPYKNNIVFVDGSYSDNTRSIIAVDAPSGKILWRTSPTEYDNLLAITPFEDDRLFVLHSRSLESIRVQIY